MKVNKMITDEEQYVYHSKTDTHFKVEQKIDDDTFIIKCTHGGWSIVVDKSGYAKSKAIQKQYNQAWQTHRLANTQIVNKIEG